MRRRGPWLLLPTLLLLLFPQLLLLLHAPPPCVDGEPRISFTYPTLLLR